MTILFSRLDQTKKQPGELALIAAHDWDVDGASKAGLTTCYLVRNQPRGFSAMNAPDASGRSLPEVVRSLLAFAG